MDEDVVRLSRAMRALLIAVVTVMSLLLGGVVVAGGLRWLTGDNPREVGQDVILPLPPPLAVVGHPREHCPQGSKPVGDCELDLAIRGPRAPCLIPTLEGGLPVAENEPLAFVSIGYEGCVVPRQGR